MPYVRFARSAVHPRYVNVARNAYLRYAEWIAHDLIPLVPLVPDLAIIVTDYVTLSEKTHFEAVINVSPKLLDWVWQYNEYLNHKSIYFTSRHHARWTEDVKINDELLKMFNARIDVMNDDAYNMTIFPEYRRFREVSIADQYERNASVIIRSNWPIGESDLELRRLGKYRKKRIHGGAQIRV
jgi:hypothetical protein